jgi:hypothetical protein
VRNDRGPEPPVDARRLGLLAYDGSRPKPAGDSVKMAARKLPLEFG